MKGKTFKYCISLGSFCSVALEMERIGLREGSYPFDWLITNDFNKVLDFIQNRFDGFLELSDLEQEEIKTHYYSKKNNLHFYHDFKDHHIPLEQQLPLVKQKYKRRIERFYSSASQPCLFIRYLSASDTQDACIRGEGIIKSLCPESDIIYIKHGNKNSFNENVAIVIPDEGDIVSRKFLQQLPQLKQYIIENVDVPYLRRKSNQWRWFKKKLIKKLELS